MNSKTIGVWAVVILLLVGAGCSTVRGGSPSKTALRGEMHQVYGAFKGLQRFLVDKQAFTDPRNENEVRRLLATLNGTFHGVAVAGDSLSKEAGFVTTLKIVNDLLKDSEKRFNEGKKGYAHWRLNNLTSYCISCHTRYEVPTNFEDPELPVASVGAFDRGEYFFATRQFDKAAEAFLQAAETPDGLHARLDALRRWLVIYTRVFAEPREAIRELQRIAVLPGVVQYEREEISSWIKSLRRWQNEGRVAPISIETAEELIRRGRSIGDRGSLEDGAVELLRASAILHKLLEQKDTSKRPEALYLLALSYHSLPMFFISELPELFLEQAIRESIGTPTARRAYRLYEEVVTFGYTGSSGTRVPAEAASKLRELHGLAFGVPIMRDRI